MFKFITELALVDIVWPVVRVIHQSFVALLKWSCSLQVVYSGLFFWNEVDIIPLTRSDYFRFNELMLL